MAKPDEFTDTDLEFFEKQIRPLLIEHCHECHAGDAHKGGLQLTSRAALLAGGDTGPAIVPGQPDKSLLVEAVNYGLYEMPPKSKLPETAIALLEDWVRRGAPWSPDVSTNSSSVEAFDLAQRQQDHWAWSDLSKPPLPAVDNTAWPQDQIDHFILGRLEQAGLAPAAPADPYALVRRAYFDLVGLPPEPEVVEKFAADPSPAAYAKLVDRLLASQHFGERWARHWLDLMRYAESRGHEFDYPIPNAWQYRDYVIRAFNTDVPYNQFLTEHIAGDLLEQPRRHPELGYNESILATGFWYLNEWVHSPVDIRQDEADRFDNSIDVMSKAFLGLTVACARCHDHKFDAISQTDYYALVGFLQSSDYRQIRFETMEHNKRVAEQLDALRAETDRQIARQLLRDSERVRSELIDVLRDAAGPAGDSSPIVRAWAQQLTAARDDEAHPMRLAEATQRARLPHPHRNIANFDSPEVIWQSDGPVFTSFSRGDIIPGNSPDEPIAEVVAAGRVELERARGDLEFAADTEQHHRQANASIDPAKRLRLPAFHLGTGQLFYKLRGAAQIHAVIDSHRLIDGPLHCSTFLVVQPDEHVRWVQQDLSRYSGHGVLIEISALDSHPLQLFEVVEATEVSGETPGSDVTSETLSHTDELSLENVAHGINTAIATCATHPAEMTDVQCRLVTWAAGNYQLWMEESASEMRDLLAHYNTAHQQLLSQFRRTSALAPAIFDSSAEDETLFVRGNPKTLGGTVPRRLLIAIDNDQPAIESGSGRLQLAERMLRSPFASRVMVNRIWHHLMGRGIVRSVDNFGVLGERPTHPELLDHLSVRFIEEGWSVKWLIRKLMLSSTYQMASTLRRDHEEADPNNLLYHRAPLRRLEAEPIRDSMLALSGRMNKTLMGPSVPVHLTPFLEGRGRPKQSGPVDGDGRRSIYLAVKRNFLSPMMLAFDRPQPSSPLGRRTVSNVPAQALTLLNDPFVLQQAHAWAKRLVAEYADRKVRLERLYLEAFGRPPVEEELTSATLFLSRQTDPSTVEGDITAWADLCHVLINSKEFIFLR